MDFFLARRVNQVKLVDRTFNCDPKRAALVWQYLIDRDNGHTNFHFEISADCLDEAAFSIFTKTPPGLFQLEIGVQSTHIPTLETIRRSTQTETTLANIARLKNTPHVHVHLDLIAGLPGESFDGFRKSFNAVYALQPDMMQLGFLKLLKGARLRDEAALHGIVYHDTPPYEVLRTDKLGYDELKILKNIENALDTLYNSGHFTKTVAYILLFFTSPFDFYRTFAGYWTQKSYHRTSQSHPKLYEILYAFTMQYGLPQKYARNYLKFDWYLAGNQQSHPEWLDDGVPEGFRHTYGLEKDPVTGRRTPFVRFDYDPRTICNPTDENNIDAADNINTADNDQSPLYFRFIHTGKPRPGAQGKKVQAIINSTAQNHPL
jgi:radical SAM superfamily enzyme YgiQ (UPF0313 family)